MLKWLDIPPMWLLGCAVLAWVQAEYVPSGLSFGQVWAVALGTILVALGLLLLVLALMEFVRKRTTPIPHMDASELITSGIFRFSRNPIYLGDILILAGLILRWDAVVSVPLVPILVWIINIRFIHAEEFRLERDFGDAFLRYMAQTRRWL
ncbi:MAG: isoprenylcysteine carboxylmethyltransferase family protein [Pseudomonadota bacterium]